MRKGLLIYEEMRKYLVIFEEAVSHIWLCNRCRLNFLIYENNLIFFFISVLTDLPPPLTHHRVYRVPGFLSYHSNWVPPTTSSARECCLPLFGSKGEPHSHAEEGVGGPIPTVGQSHRHSGTLGILYYDPTTLHITTAHYKYFIFLGDLDSAIQICIPILHRNPLNACYHIKEPNHKESVSRDWAFFWNARVD